MAIKYDVEYYLHFKEDRIKTHCQHEAHLRKLDYDIVLSEVIQHMRDEAATYKDDLGTSGFIRWMSARASTAIHRLITEPNLYEGLVARKKLKLETLHSSGRMQSGYSGAQQIPVTEATKKILEEAKEELIKCQECGNMFPKSEYYKNARMPKGFQQPHKACFRKKYPKAFGNPDRAYTRQPSKNAPIQAKAAEEQHKKIRFVKGDIKLSDALFSNEELNDMIETFEKRIAGYNYHIEELITEHNKALAKWEDLRDKARATMDKLKRRLKPNS